MPRVANNTRAAASNRKLRTPKKKKKKKDPNEPHKPVSAYALFFRDSQAAIKSQNPNASFGEISKIVASMWDGLGDEHKGDYKKRTETAKKEYLKQLAAYRATLVSTGALDSPQEPPHLSPQQHPGTPPRPIMPNPAMTSVPMTTVPMSTVQMTSSGMMSSVHMTSQMPGDNNTMPLSHMPHPATLGHDPGAGHGPMDPAMMAMHHHNGPPNAMPAVAPCPPPGHPAHMPGSPEMGMPGDAYMSNQMMASSPDMTMGSPHQGMCVRNGCINLAMNSPGWDNEYCSNECVVSHCRDVFTAWVAARQGSNSYASVK